jgi:hypothetical protein
LRARRRGGLGGIAAGLIGLGCCAGPTVAALPGIVSASTAVSAASVASRGLIMMN